jgi:hypothetical protein
MKLPRHLPDEPLFENDDRPLRKAAYVSRGETYGHGAKKDIPMLNHSVSFMYNPEAPFGLELMAERKRRGHALNCYENPPLLKSCSM